MKKINPVYAILVFIAPVMLALSGCDQPKDVTDSVEKEKLIIYSGITMVKPLKVLAKEFERQHNIAIHIEQGASGYLYKTLSTEKTGDLYFPGSESYRLNHAEDGILSDYVLVGYNRLALVVAQGNPKQLTNELSQLTNPELSVVLASPDSSAVGKATAKALEDAHLCTQVFENVTYLTTDSHRLLNSIENGDADMTINWYATTLWNNYADKVEAIKLPDELETKRKLEINLLKFSKQPELAKKFMAYASSEHGLNTFAQFGFLTEQEHAALLNTSAKTSEKAVQ